MRGYVLTPSRPYRPRGSLLYLIFPFFSDSLVLKHILIEFECVAYCIKVSILCFNLQVRSKLHIFLVVNETIDYVDLNKPSSSSLSPFCDSQKLMYKWVDFGCVIYSYF